MTADLAAEDRYVIHVEMSIASPYTDVRCNAFSPAFINPCFALEILILKISLKDSNK